VARCSALFGQQDIIFHSRREWKIAVFKALFDFVVKLSEIAEFLPLGISDPPESFRRVA
jgi:hypothetical protein